MGACESVGRCLEPCAPCLCSWMTGCDGRVVWRSGRRVAAVALTIDDVPRENLTMHELFALLQLLKTHNARATFFVIWSAARRWSGDLQQMVKLLTEEEFGHEIGVHFDGRWGCTVSDAAICQEACEAMHALQRLTNCTPKYARMPGGFSRRSTVTALENLGLTVVNGTAYPFDVDLCKGLPPDQLGRCAANLAVGGGRIAILHDRDDLMPKVAAFLDQAKTNRRRVVRLDELLDAIEPASERRRLRATAPLPALDL